MPRKTTAPSKSVRKRTAGKVVRKSVKSTTRKAATKTAKRTARKAVKKTVRELVKKKAAAKKVTRKKVARKKVARKKVALRTVVRKKTAKKKATVKTVRRTATKKVAGKKTARKTSARSTARKTVKKKAAARGAVKRTAKKVVRKIATTTARKVTRKASAKTTRKVVAGTTRPITRKPARTAPIIETPERVAASAVEFTPPPPATFDAHPPMSDVAECDVSHRPATDFTTPTYEPSSPTGPSFDAGPSVTEPGQPAEQVGVPAVGDPAPGFELRDAYGAFHSLGQYAGRRVVLFFYPKDDTPGCTTEACGFRDVSGDFDSLDAALCGISPDSPESHYQFATKFNLSYTLLSDVDHRVAQAFGVWREKTRDGRTYMGIERTTFIIDEEGRVAHVFEGVKPDGHNHEVTSWLREHAAAQSIDTHAPY